MKTLLEQKIKAVVGAVVAALTAYIGTAITTGNVLTAHGAELAAAGAVLTFLGVHQAPKNRDTSGLDVGDGGMTPVDLVLFVFVAVICLIVLIVLLRHVG